MTDQYLKEIYFNPGQPGAFAGPDKLNKVIQNQRIHKIPAKIVKQWVQNQDAYSLQKSVRRKFRRNRIIPTGRDALWDMDLADVSNIAEHNNGIKFWLIVIDVFSRYLWLKPLTNKSHISVVNALNEILFEGRIPKKIRSDKGKEFLNRWVDKLLSDKGIYHFTTQNETKANYAERVIRTMKNLVYRYIMHKQILHYCKTALPA
jgi:transposase InsO family protein